MHALTTSLFDLRHTKAAAFFEEVDYPWEVLPQLKDMVIALSRQLPADFREIAPLIWVGPGTTIAATAVILGPAIIGCNCQIRHGAFIREHVLLGDGVVIGNSTEVKQAILFDGAQAPHFNYVGDSIMGYKAHVGAGAVLSNFKAAGDEIYVSLPDGSKIPSGLNKLGGVLGDFTEVGCNAVVFPGTIVGRKSRIYPLSPARGYIPAGHILKQDGNYYLLEE